MQPPHLDLPWDSIIQAALAATFATVAWLVKKFGEQHILTIKELAKELKEMRKELSKLTERVQAVEIKQKYWHESD